MGSATGTLDRVAELEDELNRDEKIKRLTTERDEALELVDRMREHVEDHDQLTERWIEVFEMEQDDHGVWIFDRKQTELWDRYEALLTENAKLARQWNKFVPEYNAIVSPRERAAR